MTREEASYYSETVPDPKMTDYCPCDSAMKPGQEVLYRLSCIAKLNSIYVAANMGDKQSEMYGRKGHYQYNTEVAFNRQGCLVARYHKQHLFASETLKWNTPEVVEVSYFDTEFGRFGLMVCFDAVFKRPAIDLVMKHNVTNMVFSTAWMNVFPHYESVAYHSGWARTMRVNYLAANLHNPTFRYVGSGIYSADGIVNYAFNLTSRSGQLVVADLPILQSMAPAASQPKEPATLHHIQTWNSADEGFKAEVFGDWYTFIELSNETGYISVCRESTCCNLNYSRENDGELYALGVFDGMHTREGSYFLEVCLLVQCQGNHRPGCGLQPSSPPTRFDYFVLSGEMSTVYAFPEVVYDQLTFDGRWQFVDNGTYKSITDHSNQPVVSAVLMGRNFDKDPSSAEPVSYNAAGSHHSAIGVIMTIALNSAVISPLIFN